jgi:hypothetical protein
MNRKAASNVSHDATTGNDAIDQRANWQGVPIASTRIFNPYEYWPQNSHNPAQTESAAGDEITDAPVIASQPVKPTALMPGWLRDLAMVVVRQVRGP